MGIDITRVEEGGGKLWLVRGIGKKLRFKTEPIPGLINIAFFSGAAMPEVVGGVELYARHGGQNLKASPASGVKDFSGFGQALLFMVQDKIMVITPPKDQLRMGRGNITAYRFGACEVHRGPLNVLKLAIGNAFR